MIRMKKRMQILVKTSKQHIIREWEDLMEVTGGRFRKEEELLVCVLTRLDCDKESEMLGIWMAPSGEKKRMIAEMRDRKNERQSTSLGCTGPLRQGIGIRFTCGIVYHNINAAEVSSCSLNFDREGVHIHHGSSYQSRPAPHRI